METLSYQKVFDTFQRLVKDYGRGSCGGVSRFLAQEGIINKNTNRPYSRQAIRVIMSKTPEGRQLMEHGFLCNIKPPVIVDQRVGFRKWLKSRGLECNYNSMPKVGDIEDRYVYGNLPMELAVHARSVWLPVINDEPVVADITAEEFDSHKVELGEYKVKRIR